MSLASAAVNRLRELSRKVFLKNARANAQRNAYPAELHSRATLPLIEQLEPRVMLSASWSGLTNVTVGEEPNGSVIADLNGDGLDDVAVVNYVDGNVSILYAQGDGTFGGETTYTVSSSPSAIVAADFDGDTRMDLATANLDSTVTVLYGQSDGTMGERLDVAVGTTPMGLATGDLDGDTRTDVVVTNYSEGSVSVLFGQADGSLAERADYTVGSGPMGVVTGHFNADALLDVATVDQTDDTVSVLYGQGSGVLGGLASFAVGDAPTGIVTGDFDGDTVADLIVSNAGDDDVSVLFGQGDGTFASRTDYATGDNPHGMFLGELSGDEYLDLVVTNTNDDTLTVLLGQSGGVFGNRVDFGVGDGPVAVSSGDFNGDGVADFAVANRQGDDVSFLYGQNSNQFGTYADYEVGGDPESLVSADFNGDTYMDIAVANSADGDVSIWYGQADGSFANRIDVSAGSGPMDLVAGDFNDDTRQDLAIVNMWTDNDITVLYGQAGGGFGGRIDLPAGQRPQGIDVGLLNDDAYEDLVVTNLWDDTVSVFYGQADGGFSTANNFTVGDGPRDVTIGDFNDDDRMDLAVTNAIDDDVAVLYGLEAGGFGDRADFAVGETPYMIVTGNFNGDAYPDLAVTSALIPEAPGSISVLYGQSDGSFAGRTDYAVGEAPRGIEAGQFNGDSYLDLAIVNAFDDDITIYYGQSDGSFGGRVDIPVGDYPQGIISGHFDMDGYTDLAVTNLYDDTVRVLHQGDPNLKVSDVSSTGLAVQPGAEVTLTFTTHNDGDADAFPTGAATFETQLFLSNDQLVTTGDTQVGSGTATFSSIPANGMIQNTFTFTAPTTPGTYYLAATADGGAVVLEANETDNWSDTVTLLVLEKGWFGDRTDQAAGSEPQDVVLGDFNGDGRQDVAIANATDNDIAVLYGQSDGSFSGRVDYAVGLSPIGIAAAHLDDDAYLDLATVNSNTDSVTVWYGQADGTFSGREDYATGSGPEGIATGDFDEDTRTDIVVTNHFGDSATVLFGQDGGGFGEAASFSTGVDGGPSGIAVGDFNGDDDLDIVAVNHFKDNVAFLFGNGDGTFGAPYEVAMTGSGNRGVAVANFDGLGGLDVAVPRMFDDVVTVYYGDGGGTFSSIVDYPANTWPEHVVAADFNEDGLVDIGVAGANLGILYGLESGGFADVVGYDADGGLGGIASADLNGDGLLDLAAADYESDLFSRWYGQTSAGPNLIVSNTTPTEVTANPGESVTLTIVTRNDGAADANPLGSATFETQLFLSNDATVTTGDAQVAAGSATFSTIADGTSRSRTFTFNAPTTPGTYYLKATADGDDWVTESDETDNWGSLVTLTVLSDLDRYDRDNAQNLGAIGNAVKKVAGVIGKTATSQDYNDWFKFTVNGRRKITATLTGMTRNANLQLTDASGNVLKTSARTGTNNETVVFNVTPADLDETGTYYLRVYTTSKVKTKYTLAVKAVADVEKQIWQRAFNLGTPGSRAKITNGTIGGVDVNDWYKFTVRGIKKVTLRLDQMKAGSSTQMQLMRTVGGTPDTDTPVATETLNAVSTTTRATIVEVLTAGTYYVKLSTTDTSVSPYRLYTRALGDRDAATRTTARNLGYLAAPKSITGKVGMEDRNDWFKFSTRSFTRRVTLTLTGLTGDANLALYDARGRKLVISSEAGTADEQIIRNLRVGTYYVRVMVPGQTSLDSSIDYTLEMAAPRA